MGKRYEVIDVAWELVADRLQQPRRNGRQGAMIV